MPSLVDNILQLAGKYDIQHPYEYQAAQRAAEEERRGALANRHEQEQQALPTRAETTSGPSATSKKRSTADSLPFKWPHCPPGAKRPRYSAADFQTAFSAEEEVRSWYSRFEGFLSKRNFYVLQEHHATANHWDLRIQLDGGLVSFCIPKGLFNFAEGSERRYVVWQPVHPISDCLVEGGSVGSKKVDSIGLYTMKDTLSRMKKLDAVRKRGFDDAETTDEDENAQSEDERQEDLFAQAYYYTLFKPLDSRWGQPAAPSPRKDPRKGRAFVIELNGPRLEGVKLHFFRKPGDIKYQHSKSISTTVHTANQLPEWMVSIHRGSPSTVTDTSFGKKSILTDRTMEQIRADRSEQERLETERGAAKRHKRR